jgi:hypothetical protein
MTPKEIQGRIDQLRKEIDDIISFRGSAIAEISKRQSEIFVLASQLSEISTRRMEFLTKHLVYLTYVLAALTLGLFVVELCHH